LTLHDVFITAAVRCAPPDNRPAPDELAACLSHLEAEAAALPNVQVVVALGKFAFDAYQQLLRRRAITISPRLHFAHGSVDRLPDGCTLVGCYHPSRQNTNTGKLTASMMRDILQRVSRLLAH
jgi:uracil-DNA glycosylase family 4